MSGTYVTLREQLGAAAEHDADSGEAPLCERQPHGAGRCEAGRVTWALPTRAT